jgi:hypothetical protein
MGRETFNPAKITFRSRVERRGPRIGHCSFAKDQLIPTVTHRHSKLVLTKSGQRA